MLTFTRSVRGAFSTLGVQCNDLAAWTDKHLHLLCHHVQHPIGSIWIRAQNDLCSNPITTSHHLDTTSHLDWTGPWG